MRLPSFLPFLALAVLACDRPSRTPASTQAGSSAIGAGPQTLVLRVPRAGGTPRVHAYPRVDSVVWSSTDPAPTPAHVLAFDDENGSVAYEDTRGRPVLLELRLGTITVSSGRRLTGLASANGTAIFGIAADGNVVRMTPTGDWSYKPPQAARAVFPQMDGAILVTVGSGANTHLVRVMPPQPRVLQELPFPVATRTARTQLGDRLYLAVDSGLIVFRTRTMDWAPRVPFAEPIAVMASTPSGDRLFVLTDSRRQISTVDRFREAVTGRVDLPAKAGDLRVDPFGRYLLARVAERDSVWVVAIGTGRILGALRSSWRGDLPFVGIDGAIAVASGDDVVFFDGETLRERSRVRGGARDFWHPLIWDGFRPRSAALDEPVRFDSLIADAPPADDTLASDAPPPPPAADTVAQRGYIVSFAAFLAAERAQELAARIRVGGRGARVITSLRDGSVIHRVVLGPYPAREDAERAGRESGQAYWVYEGVP